VGTVESFRSDERDDRDRQFDHIVGNSPALESTLAEVQRVAPTDSTVLVLGETGTGKELIAHAMHKFEPALRLPVYKAKLRCHTLRPLGE